MILSKGGAGVRLRFFINENRSLIVLVVCSLGVVGVGTNALSRSKARSRSRAVVVVETKKPVLLKEKKSAPVREVASVGLEEKPVEEPIIKAKVDAATIRKMLKANARKKFSEQNKYEQYSYGPGYYAVRNSAAIYALEFDLKNKIYREEVIAYNKTLAGLQKPLPVPPQAIMTKRPDMGLVPEKDSSAAQQKFVTTEYKMGIFYTDQSKDWAGGVDEVTKEIMQKIVPRANSIQNEKDYYEVEVTVIGNIHSERNASKAIADAWRAYDVVYVYEGKRNRDFQTYLP